MDDEVEENTLLCGSKGQISLDEQHRYIRAKQQVDASDAKCAKYGMLLDETQQQLRQCRQQLAALSSRRDQAAALARRATEAGRPASLGYLRDRLAGLEANMAQQERHRLWLASRLTTLEKFAAAAAFEDGRLVSTRFFVSEMEEDFKQRKQAQKNCYIQREEKLAKIYEDSVCRREDRDRRTLLGRAARGERLRRQAVETVERIDGHVSNTLSTLQREQRRQLSACEGQRRRRSEAVRQLAHQLEYTREVLRVQQQQRPPAQGAAAAPAGQHAVTGGAQKLQARLEQRRAALAAAERSRSAAAARQRANTLQIAARLALEERRRLQESRPQPPGAGRPRSLPPLAAGGAPAGEGAALTELSGQPGPPAEAADSSPGDSRSPAPPGETAAGAAAEPQNDSDPQNGQDQQDSQVPQDGQSSQDGESCRSAEATGDSEAAEAGAGASSLPAAELERLRRLMGGPGGGGGGDGSSEGSLSSSQHWGSRRPDMPVQRPPVTSRPCPFSWKPDVIQFNDFQVGWTYRRRVSIVNLSRCRSSCRYLGIFEHNYYQLRQPLSESLSVLFEPPGSLGTGLAARLRLRFTPRLLVGGECLLRFLAPNGEFQVPVRFVAQRCEPRLERTVLEFGDMVIGQRMRRSVTLKNAGSKGCRFTVRPETAGGQGTEQGPAEGQFTTEQEPTEGQGAEQAPAGAQGKEQEPAGGQHTEQEPTLGQIAEEQRPVEQQGTEQGAEQGPADVQAAVEQALAGDEGPAEGQTGGSATAATEVPAVNSPGPGGHLESAPASHPSSAAAHTATALVHSLLADLLDRLPIIDFSGGLGVLGGGRGELPAAGRARLHLGCVADLPGSWRQRFTVEFDDPDCPPLTLTASYTGHEFPISVRNPHLSLDICLCGLTYWDTFHIVNSGKVASRVRTTVPEEMRPYVEIQGSPALVQADSTFKVKIFFKPKRCLLSPPHRYLDPATHVLDLPVRFTAEVGAARAAPLSGSLQAAVSSEHLWLRPERLELGRLTLLESVGRRLWLTNGGLTAQRCRFTDCPDSVTVQPGHGGALLLPGETVPLEVIFSPSVAGHQQFPLTVQTLDGGRATVVCRGLATSPPLSLSATSIKLSGVPVQGQARAAVYVRCPKVPLAEEPAAAGGGSFQFQPPEACPVSLHPLVGFVPYKQSRRVEVTVCPRLDDSEVRITASLLRYEQLEMEQAAAEHEQSNKKGKGKKKQSARKKGKPAEKPFLLCPEPGTIQPTSAVYREAERVLLRTCEPATRRYLIPCCVRPGGLHQRPAAPSDVLYLEIVCTAVRPHLVAGSPACLQFGPRALEAPARLALTLEAAAEGPLRPQGSALDPHGPFRLLRPLPELSPGQRVEVLVAFTPDRLTEELEFWTVTAGNARLRFALSGRGVKPQFTMAPEDGLINMGKAKLGKTTRKQVVVTNQCDAPLEFSVRLQSALPDACSAPGSGPARRSGRRQPEPEPEPGPVWAVSAPLLAVEPRRSAALEVRLCPAAEGLYEARLTLSLFHRLAETVLTATGRTPGYKPAKREGGQKPSGGKDSARKKGGKGKKK